MKKITLILLTFITVEVCSAQTASSEYMFTGGSLQNHVNSVDFTRTGESLTFITGIENIASGAVSLNGDVLNNPAWVSDNGASDNDYSTAFWIKTSDNTSTTKEVFNHYTTYGWKFTLVNGDLSFYGKFSTAGTSASNQPPPHTYSYSNIADGQWHFVVLTLDKSAFPAGGGAEFSRVRYKVYIDNVLKSNVEKQKVNIGNHFSIPNAQIYIGDNKDLNGVRYIDGLDNIRYYSGLLGVTDIATLYNELIDTTDPNAIAEDITVQLDETGNITVDASEVDGGSTDNFTASTDLILSLDRSSFDCTDIGENVVTLTVTDGSENTATTTAIITVEDKLIPIATSQDITIYLDGDGQVTITPEDVNNASTDNCSIDQMVLDISGFTCDDLGANTVMLTVTDASGNSNMATATVTVEDNTDPSVVTQDITVSLGADGTVSISTEAIDNGSTDNCSIASMSLDITDFDCDDLGANIVTLTLMDASGNISASTANVTVEDATAPTALAQDITIQIDKDGNTMISADNIDNGSSDNCNSITLSIDKTDFTCADLGANTVTLTVIDGSGNRSTIAVIVTVEEVDLPIALAQSITIQLDDTGNAVLSADDLDNGSTDNCTDAVGLIFSLDKTDFSCTDIGENMVTLIVTDASGNKSSATAVVTVEDVTAPTAIAQDIVVQQGIDGTVTVSATEVNNSSLDECSADLTFTLSKNIFDCDDLGANAVTLTVTDESGNQSTTDAMITVEDNIVPTIGSQNITVQLGVTGNVSVDASSLNATSFDNCSANLTFTLSQMDFDCSNLGENTVSFLVTDDSGNTTTQDVIITIEESKPTVVTKNITVELDESGNATISAMDINSGSTDDCTSIEDLTLSIDVVDFSCEDVGVTNQVTLTVTDSNGNISTETATVTIVDLSGPTVVTQDVNIILDGSGNATITSTDVDNGSSDNCTLGTDLIYSLDVTIFDTNDLGANTVTLSVTDASGNVGMETAVVTVSDKKAQAVVFTGVVDKTFGDADFTVSTSIDSNLPVNYMVVSGGLTISGTDGNSATFSITGAGTITIEVTNDGDDTYAPLKETITIEIAKADQVLTVDQITNKSVATQSIAVNANIDTGLALDYSVSGPATISGNVVVLNGTVGTISVTVSQAGNDNYNMVSQTISFEVVEKQSQTITFTDIPDLIYGASDQVLSATSSSNLTTTFSVVSGPATLSGNTLSITGTGVVVVKANQAGNDDYLEASIQQTIDVGSASLVVTADNQTINYNDAVPDLTFSYSGFVNGEGVADLIAEPVISTGADSNSEAGAYSIILTGGEAANYTFELANATLTINKGDQVITVEPIADKEPTDGVFEILATVDSGLGLIYDVSGPATVSGTTITLDGAIGMVTVTVSQEGTVNYTAASASITFQVDAILSIDEIDHELAAYPNPFTNELHFDAQNIVLIKIYSLEGREVINQKGVRNLDVSSLGAGTYILEIYANDKVLRTKILKQQH